MLFCCPCLNFLSMASIKKKQQKTKTYEAGHSCREASVMHAGFFPHLKSDFSCFHLLHHVNLIGLAREEADYF